LNVSSRLDFRSGLVYGFAAYGLWGVMPLYFHAVTDVPALELVSHRVLWSVLLLAVVLAFLGRWTALLRCLRVPRTRWLLVASTLLIASNWYAFIHGVNTGQVVQNSMGLFVTPLLSVLLGVVFFRERLRPVQWLALGLAAAGLVYQVVALGEWPWIAFYLAGSFAAYGLIRKVAPVDTLVGLTAETLLLLPAALAALAWWGSRGRLSLGAHGPALDALLVASGAITAEPLFCFGQAARLLPLSVLGFLQYLAPSLQFLLAVLVFEEPFRPAQQVSFGMIWAALALVSVQALLARRAARADLGRADRPPARPGLPAPGLARRA
jgi:chloramphenicol-sensitive protein RarD